MQQTTSAMIVVGDEILSGRTRDSNMHHLAGLLTAKGIPLREVRVVADAPAAIVAAVRALSPAHGHVFTSGGIGPTHDDRTADAVAEAMGAPIDVREDARALLQAHYDRQGIAMNEARLRMARIPEGAVLIDNPVSAAPGFSLGNVHVMAGVPKIFAAMCEGLLPRLTGGAPILSESVPAERGEGDVAALLAGLQDAHPALDFGSYPFQRPDGRYGTNLVIRGTDAAALARARAELEAALAALP
ncbi:molybdenum cofactor synthesis domain-containing protein [Hasllibacter halocynthiae]|uniref:Molybdenum cofactor synthesis domain-containing protein n=1 Tax=Hasllibacter halocynthiae TaxID=595589 RepID=A0A2T0X1Y0_9RHOB|nr:molybdopterin-binding protein [Hasllibacter halocynthiae]PRY92941.1 molybdenum cofactor synthesis domain-containing protein [Hasllibacter halocynthiae]